jgi:DNA-directed RNA polymerase sigma subunit (sigma70/sigma32)
MPKHATLEKGAVMTLEEVGRVLGLPKQTVCQIEKRALKKLRAAARRLRISAS